MSDQVVIDIDAKELEMLVRQFPQLETVLFAEINSAMTGSIGIIHEQVTGRTPVGVSGNLRNSISPVIRGRSPFLIGDIRTSMVYGRAVEHGLPPGHRVHPEALELWVIRKLGVSPDESKQVASAIAEGIRLRGTRGKHMFEEGFEAARQPVEKLWRGVPVRAINRFEATSR